MAMDIIGMYPTFYVPYIGTAWVMGIIGDQGGAWEWLHVPRNCVVS
jgi:hypothetical protein